MKILSLKYKMHKLVNLVFYVIVFGLGFLLGFLGNKINFNDLLSNFLYIDKVYAEESNINQSCHMSYNLANIEDLYLNVDNNRTYSYYFDNTLPAGQYTISYELLNENNSNTYVSILAGSSDLTNVKLNLNGKTFFTINSDFNRLYFYISSSAPSGTEVAIKKIMFAKGTYSTYEPFGQEICVEIEDEEKEDILIDVVNDNFYNFSKKIIGDLGEENYFVYDFITLGLISVCFIFFVLLVGYIIKKFFGG